MDLVSGRRSRIAECTAADVLLAQSLVSSSSSSSSSSLVSSSSSSSSSPSVTLGSTGALRLSSSSSCPLAARHAATRPSLDYFQGCKWAPDGSCLLVGASDHTLRLFALPYYAIADQQAPEPDTDQPKSEHAQTLSNSTASNNHNASSSNHEQLGMTSKDSLEELVPTAGEWLPFLQTTRGESIYDFAWYPQMNSSVDPATACFATTARAHPVHLVDAYTGETRCSYRSYDDKDEIASPFSLGFSQDGTRLMCGHQDLIDIFDTLRPGRECTSLRLRARGKRLRRALRQERNNADQTATPVRRPAANNNAHHPVEQGGIISCFATPSDNAPYFAAGSYDGTVGLYSSASDNPVIDLLAGPSGGITQLAITPDNRYLIAGGRKSPDMVAWDLRNMAFPLCRFARSCSSYQRLAFDLEGAVSGSTGWMVAGSDRGIASAYWLPSFLSIASMVSSDWLNPTADTPSVSPDKPPSTMLFKADEKASFQAHSQSPINGISIHPYFPIIATCSGERPQLLTSEAEPAPPVDSPSVTLWQVPARAVT
ncbi:WD repeat-containing protein 79 [Capsaspora owczarzaki ATCC 30864]|uniref:WD repeat-containing protein 79 n=1 Tax=Capsaspora owczarzaki (strain ATCC 30864) TaxID=595528 RepID=A0A0D2WRL4_CAPO3|nr:WD repeat-containing protein 79 [Capsaspora owczarzaki ATCC 30864]KJE93918.1 WD repeat-containing protein 79 [Capsaspora owczarzaki ATCC 30864]|eukprot:XP_004347382.1 WD repeat-containing protein 79 [Capsaspora owczarzaki ATCC 30864]